MDGHQSRRLFIIAGEASGDLHASRLVSSLHVLDTHLDVRGWGGNLMAESGVDISKHYRELAFMGFSEVIKNLRTILLNLQRCKEEILDFRPDALILIDYPGFNLRIARFARKNKIPVFYYISPQVWAWKRSRVRQIQRDVDKLFVILPFEKDFYAGYGIDVEYHGHPLIDILEVNHGNEGQCVAILPGSRRQEVERMLPPMLEASRYFPDTEFVIAGTSVLGDDFYRPFVANHRVSIVFDSTYYLLRRARAALVTSGTATLETALIGIPQIVCYKASPISYLIARALIKVPFISLVNLVLGKKVVEELIQDRVVPSVIAQELKGILADGPGRSDIIEAYHELRKKLGNSGVTDRVASRILELMSAGDGKTS